MPSTFPRINILAAALVGAVLMTSTTQAAAQAAQRTQEAREQRAEKPDKPDKSGSHSKELFPQAERAEPDEKASGRMSPKPKQMIDTYQDGQNENARVADDEIIT